MRDDLRFYVSVVIVWFLATTRAVLAVENNDKNKAEKKDIGFCYGVPDDNQDGTVRCRDNDQSRSDCNDIDGCEYFKMPKCGDEACFVLNTDDEDTVSVVLGSIIITALVLFCLGVGWITVFCCCCTRARKHHRRMLEAEEAQKQDQEESDFLTEKDEEDYDKDQPEVGPGETYDDDAEEQDDDNDDDNFNDENNDYRSPGSTSNDEQLADELEDVELGQADNVPSKPIDYSSVHTMEPPTATAQVF